MGQHICIKDIVRDGTRTRSLPLRRRTPYPLGHADAIHTPLNLAYHAPQTHTSISSSLILTTYFDYNYRTRTSNISRLCTFYIELFSYFIISQNSALTPQLGLFSVTRFEDPCDVVSEYFIFTIEWKIDTFHKEIHSRPRYFVH